MREECCSSEGDEWGDEGDDFYDPIKDESSECVGVLMDITNNFMSYNSTVMHIFRNSGKGTGRM